MFVGATAAGDNTTVITSHLPTGLADSPACTGNRKPLLSPVPSIKFRVVAISRNDSSPLPVSEFPTFVSVIDTVTTIVVA